jgi:hypothetical protein
MAKMMRTAECPHSADSFTKAPQKDWREKELRSKSTLMHLRGDRQAQAATHWV